MKTRTWMIWSLLALGPAFAAPRDTQAPGAGTGEVDSGVAERSLDMLWLKDGRTLWGTVDDHGEDGFSFVRLDNGGRLFVPWSLLDPTQEAELRTRYGYVDHSGEELMLEADRLVLTDGKEILGRIIERRAADLVVKSRGRLLYVPKLKLREGAGRVLVPALEIFTRDELYQDELARLSPSNAAEHYELGRYCERILDFVRAVQHYTEARDLDPEVQPDLAQLLERAQIKSEHQEQLDYLYEMDARRARKKYDEALAMAAEFAELFPRSPLMSDLKSKTARIERDRERFLHEETLERWHQWAGKLAAEAARTMDYEETLAYLSDELSEDILRAVTENLQRQAAPSVTPEEVRQYFDGRDLRRTRVHKASYGQGTWLLGAEEARKGIEDRKPEEKKLSAKDTERKRLEEKIKRYLKNQESVRRARTHEAEGDESGDFWDQWSSGGKTQWVLAYYAEHGGDMVARGATFANCRDCGGTGVRKVLNLGAAGRRPDQRAEEVAACRTCHHVGVTRRVSYR